MKFCAKCLTEIDTKDGENLCEGCQQQAAGGQRVARTRQRRKQLRRERHEVLTSLGMTRVRGALGGTYYE